MSKIEKLLERIKNNPAGVRFNDICRMAEAFGFEYKGGRGRHRFIARTGLQKS